MILTSWDIQERLRLCVWRRYVFSEITYCARYYVSRQRDRSTHGFVAFAFAGGVDSSSKTCQWSEHVKAIQDSQMRFEMWEIQKQRVAVAVVVSSFAEGFFQMLSKCSFVLLCVRCSVQRGFARLIVGFLVWNNICFDSDCCTDPFWNDPIWQEYFSMGWDTTPKTIAENNINQITTKLYPIYSWFLGPTLHSEYHYYLGYNPDVSWFHGNPSYPPPPKPPPLRNSRPYDQGLLTSGFP